MTIKLSIDKFLDVHAGHQTHLESASVVAISEVPGQDGHDECLDLQQLHCDECGSDSAPFSLPKARAKAE